MRRRDGFLKSLSHLKKPGHIYNKKFPQKKKQGDTNPASFTTWWFFSHAFEKYAIIKMGSSSPNFEVKNKKYVKPAPSFMFNSFVFVRKSLSKSHSNDFISKATARSAIFGHILGQRINDINPWIHDPQIPGQKSNIWGFPKIGVPQNGWFILENLIKRDDLGVPYFRKHPFHQPSKNFPTYPWGYNPRPESPTVYLLEFLTFEALGMPGVCFRAIWSMFPKV